MVAGALAAHDFRIRVAGYLFHLMSSPFHPRMTGACAALLLSSALLLRAQQPDTTATRASLRDADRGLAEAVASRGAAAFLEALEPDAAVLFPGQPILRGPGEARAPFAARYGSPSRYAWAPVHEVASTDGLLGCTAGVSTFTDAKDAAGSERYGWYVTCWRRTPGGLWRVAGHQRGEASLGKSGGGLQKPPHSATTSSDAGAMSEILQADGSFAAMSSDSGPGPAFARFAANDAMLLGGSDTPRGPSEIRAAFDGFPGSRELLWEPAPSFGAATGGLGFTVGHATNKPSQGHVGPEGHSKYITVWRREADGHWYFVLDLGSQRP